MQNTINKKRKQTKRNIRKYYHQQPQNLKLNNNKFNLFLKEDMISQCST